MNQHEAPYTAGEVVADLQRRDLIPSGPAPAPARRHRTAEALAYVLSGAYLGLAGIVAALIVIELLK